ncbi:recombinase family protein [Nocardia sp. NPDC020380]|uniref:recombinase family protein n=1 Tax=Nocardia sp. NPDC020380 TaxID=3364309 RepID=UPI00379F5E91
MQHAPNIIGARLYSRVSDDPDGMARSVGEQDTDNRRTCTVNKWPILGEYSDNDIGASRWTQKKHRPEWERLLEDIRPGEVVVTWEASRATRDMKVYQRLADSCEELGAYWCYSGRLYDLSDPDDQFTTGLEVLLSAREASMTRKRVLRAMKANIAEGKPHGKCPFGYRAVRDRLGNLEEWVIDPPTAALVREAADRVLEHGDGIMTVAKDFNRRGLPTPAGAAAAGTVKANGKVAQGWSNTTVRRLLMNPQIAGLRAHEKKAVGKGTWDGIITEDEHYRLVAILGDSGRLKHRGTEPKNLLSGIGKCGNCKAFISKRTGHGKQYYYCPACGEFSRPVHYIDPIVEETVLLWLEKFDIAEYAAKTSPTSKADVSALEGLRARLAEYEDKAALGEISSDSFARISKKLEGQISEAEQRLKKSVRTPVRGLEEVTGSKARGAWKRIDFRRKREIVSGVVTVWCDPLPDEVKLKRDFLPDYVRYTDWLE